MNRMRTETAPYTRKIIDVYNAQGDKSVQKVLDEYWSDLSVPVETYLLCMQLLLEQLEDLEEFEICCLIRDHVIDIELETIGIAKI